MTSPVSASNATRTRTRDPELDSAGPASKSSSPTGGKGPAAAGKTGNPTGRTTRDALENLPVGTAPTLDLSRLAGLHGGSPGGSTSISGRTPHAAPAVDTRVSGMGFARQQFAQVLQLNRSVADAARKVRSIDPMAERIAGVGGMVTAAPALLAGAVKSAVTADGTHLAHAADEAERSTSYAAGELGDKIATANGAYDVFAKQVSAYVDANHRYQVALDNLDYPAAAAAGRNMDSLVGQMKQSAERFGALAASVARASKRFDGDVVTTAIHMYASALTLGAFAGAGGAEAATGAAHFAKDVVKHMAVDAAVAEGLSLLRPHE